ncbi:MAG: GIY-YIG nuclease family protein [Chitinophagaceae bacterium]|nr:GIY-YIG nuclease family protein [Chitinophagaceae bacterium]
MFFVYVLRSQKDGRFYVGLTDDVTRRLKEHNSGKTKSTKGFIPWELLFFETFVTRIEARNREKYLKSGVGKEYVKSYWSGSSVG